MKCLWKQIIAALLTFILCVNLSYPTIWAADAKQQTEHQIESQLENGIKNQEENTILNKNFLKEEVSIQGINEELQEVKVDKLSKEGQNINFLEEDFGLQEKDQDIVFLEENSVLKEGNSVDEEFYTTINAKKGIRISTKSNSYQVNSKDKFEISIIIDTEMPYQEDSHVYIGYLAVLVNHSWQEITSWWIDGGKTKYTFTLNSNDFPVNQELRMTASVFPADNFTVGASLCDHFFYLNVTDKEIEKNNLSDCTILLSSQDFIYDGIEKRPDITVKKGDIALTYGIDYTLDYRNNINAGTATILVTGIGNYTGSVIQNFIIQRADPVLTFPLEAVLKQKTDAPFTLEFTKKTDEEVTFYSNNTKATEINSSTGEVTIKGIGSAVITASVSEGENYKEGSASYTLIVAEENSYHPIDQSVMISAQTENTITIVEASKEEESQLIVKKKSYSIQRDYSQTCMLEVTNNNEEIKEFYLEAINPYPDLSLQIIKSGSKNSPMIIEPKETLEVELTVFAQNAERDNYSIPITVYVKNGEEYIRDSSLKITLQCNIPKLDFVLEKLSEEESTLRQKYRLTNKGDTLTDLVLLGSKELEDYISFEPILSNYELLTGESIEFSVSPDLAKMKKNGVSLLNGTIIAACAGLKKEFPCSFDTKGKEITVTTMGELALKQKGNPYTKFEVIKDSEVLQYFNGKEYTDISKDTTIEELLDEKNLLDFQYQNKVELGGEEEVLSYEMKIQSSIVMDEAENNQPPSVTVDEEGKISIHTQIILSAEEYYNSLVQGIKNQNLASELTVDSAENIDKVKENFSFDNQKYAYDIVETMCVNKVKSDIIETVTGFEWMSDVCDIAELALDGEIVAIHSSNPRLDKTAIRNYQAAYAMKAILTIGKIIVTAVNPVVGAFFDLATTPLDVLIGYYSDASLQEAYANYAAICKDILGHQCTNRGSITTSFYAPDYAIDKEKKPSLHISSRMSGGNYVDKTDTNYNILLNNKSTGTVSNTGLTEVTMAYVPTDNLKPGETNKLTLDYDTNPGSHSVTTDTTITLLYPNDTRIAYIDTPEDLQDVRTLPDFAVYPENIYTQGELIAGEKTVISFHVYNRGSRGGWFTITGYDGETEIFRKENTYLAAFDEETYSVDWTPNSDTSEIRISLENTSINLAERKSDNNIAVKNLTVRQREVPVIKELYFEDIYEMESYSLRVDVESGKDVLDIAFAIDGIIADNRNVQGYYGNSFQRYQFSSDNGLAKGEHKVTVIALYQTAVGKEAITKEFSITILEKKIPVPYVEVISDSLLFYGSDFEFYVYDAENLIRTEIAVNQGNNSGSSNIIEAIESKKNAKKYIFPTETFSAGEYEFVIKMYYKNREGEQVKEEKTVVQYISEEESFFTFTLDNKINSPKFYIYNKDSRLVDCNISQKEDGSYQIQKTVDMYESPEDYTLIVTYQSGIIIQKIDTKEGKITTDGCYTLTVQHNNTAYLNNIYLQSIDNLKVACPLETADTLLLSPGVYQFVINGTISNADFYRTIEVDVSQKNQIIDLSDFILDYSFEMKDSETEEYSAYLYYLNNRENATWGSYSFYTSFEKKNRILSCYSTREDIKDKVQQAKEVKLVIYSDSELFIVPIKNNEEQEKVLKEGSVSILSKNNLNKVSMICVKENVAIQKVEVLSNLFSVNLYGDTLYLPDGEYTFDAEINIGTQVVKSKAYANIIENNSILLGEDIINSLASLEIRWKEPFDKKAIVESRSKSGKQGYASEFESGMQYFTENGLNRFDIHLSQSGKNGQARYFIQREMELSNTLNQETKLELGNVFTGSISENWREEYFLEDTIYFSISNIYDKYQNNLNYFSADLNKPFYVNIVYTDIENPEHVLVETTTTFSNTISARVPKEAGTYTISVWLYSDIIEAESVFADVKEESWQYSAAEYVYLKGIMTGKGKDAEGMIKFAPDDSLSREEFAQILYAAEGKPEAEYTNQFSDVKANQWYTKAILWAGNQRIVSGYANGKFGVGNKITREQLAAILYKYAQYKGYDITKRESLGKFADSTQISSWAKEQLQWAVANGIINGKGTKLDAFGNATRAECAAMLRTFLVIFAK